jgi:hypothetical protein
MNTKERSDNVRLRQAWILAQAANYEEQDLMIADGLDFAIIGVAECAGYHRVCYSTSAVISGLVEQGMEHSEAEEYFSYNIQGAFIANGPIFVDDIGLV